MVQIAKDFSGSQVVQPGHSLLDIALHRIGLARARLAIGKAGHLGAHESTINERLDTRVINLLIIRILIEGEVKIESSFLYVLG